MLPSKGQVILATEYQGLGIFSGFIYFVQVFHVLEPNDEFLFYDTGHILLRTLQCKKSPVPPAPVRTLTLLGAPGKLPGPSRA